MTNQSTNNIANNAANNAVNDTIKIHTLLDLGPMENQIHLIEDLVTHETAIVDPAWEPEEILNFTEKHQINITHILLTHGHPDHVNGVDAMQKKTNAPVRMHPREIEFWGFQNRGWLPIQEGETIQLGNSEISVIDTPGHSIGSVCYYTAPHLITGDTLFVFGCGHCRLPGANPSQLFHSLQRLKTELPDETILHIGHDYAIQKVSTLSEEKAGNPFLHFDREEDFIRYRTEIHDQIRHDPYEPVSQEDALASLNRF